MIKIWLISLIVLVHSACAPTERQAEPDASNAPQISAEKLSPTPVVLRSLGEVNLERLDQRFPKWARDILENTQRIQVYETEVCYINGWTLSPIEKNRFQGCKILRQADVTEPEQIKQLVDGVIFAIGSSDSGAACFDPRHGIRAEHAGKRVELLICFECENFRGASSLGSFAGGFSLSARELFERILAGKKGVRK